MAVSASPAVCPAPVSLGDVVPFAPVASYRSRTPVSVTHRASLFIGTHVGGDATHSTLGTAAMAASWPEVALTSTTEPPSETTFTPDRARNDAASVLAPGSVRT